MRFFRNWWFVTIACALLLVLVLAIGLPLVVGFLRPLWVRILCVLLVAAGWGLLAWLRWRKARRAADAIAAELTPPSAADAESRILAERMRKALGELKGAAGKPRDYLYARPWYVIIGPPGAGKTTALRGSGLGFSDDDQSVKGVGGTRNLDFWFADEAVMIDTAGRYTTQDSDARTDAAGWTALLQLLKRNRPLQPVNGIIVAIGIDALIESDCEGIDAHARAVRRRLAEMRRTLEVGAPIYVMLTKADLLSGFTEYFADLDVEGRRAVAGATLPLHKGRVSAEVLAVAFDEMAQAIADRQAKRLHEEPDARRRSLLLGFPSQLQSVRTRLMRFMEGVFTSADEPAGILRGFYLTSGTQGGAPLDRILASLAQVYDLAPEPVARGTARAYFLNRLLTQVMIPEAGLVTMDPKARLRQRGRMIGAFAGIAAACMLCTLLWSVSFANNRSFQQDLLVRANAVREDVKARGIDARQVREGEAGLREVIPVLDALRDLPHGFEYARKNGGPPLMMTLGLYQSGLAASAGEAYRDGLRRILLPRLMLRLEQYLRASGDDPMQLFEPLKAYLLLGGRHRMDAGAVRGWVTNDWAMELMPGADAAGDRAALTRHLNALLGDRDLALAWKDRRPPLDGELVHRVREQLGTLDPSLRAYALLRQRSANPDADWTVAGHLNPGEVTAFANPEVLLAKRVPYFFTRKGFERAYVAGRATIEKAFKDDYWVFTDNPDPERVRAEAANVQGGIAGRYAQDYVAAWKDVIAAMQPVDYFDPANRAAFGAFTRVPSPLKKILSEVRRNTTFAGGVAAAIQRGTDNQLGRMRVGGYIRDMEKGRATGMDAGAEIAGAFEEVNLFTGDEKGQGGVDRFVSALEKAVTASFAADPRRMIGGSSGAGDQLAVANADLMAAASSPPGLIASFIQTAAGRGAAVETDIKVSAVSRDYARKVLPDCRATTEARYPFDRNARENASAQDMDRVFGRGGTIDSFVTQVQSLIEIGPIWRWNSANTVAAAFNPESPAQFAKAGEIRDLINIGLPLQVSLLRMGSGVTGVEVTSNDTTRSFAGTTAPPQPLQWSMRGLQQAAVVLQTASGEQRISDTGPWALFRVMERATERRNDGAAIRFTFGSGATSATLLVRLPTARDPFSRTDLWSFRCPSSL